MPPAIQTVSFHRMKDATKEDYELLRAMRPRNRDFIVGNALHLLAQLDDPPGGFKINRLQHSLQSATRALRDEADDETVVCALLHDIGDVIAPDNHAAVIAELMRPFVSDENYWVLKYHGLFQGYYYLHHMGADRNLRDRYRDHQHYAACARFVERWDQASFDPDYDTLPLETFEPLVQQLFARPPKRYLGADPEGAQ